MRKLIHSSFELDLSPFKISDTEENNWFSDGFFLKYSFPFEIDLEEDLDIAFGFISQHNSEDIKTYFDLLYVHGDRIEKAVLEVESIQDKLSCVLRYGFEQLPSFDKKLSELSLVNFSWNSPATIYEHAETIITKTWPDVNYNFPQIHVDKYDTSDDLWTNFLGILNNRVGGAFLENTVDTVDNITYNKNIIQPLPYFMHILQRGMIDAGYELSGKILEDDRIKKACLYGDVEYFKRLVIDDINSRLMSEDAISFITSRYGYRIATYVSHVTLLTPGKYNIVGDFLTEILGYVYFEIKYRNIVLYTYTAEVGAWFNQQYVDVNFETISDANPHEVTITSHIRENADQTVFDIDFILLRANDSVGAATPSVINERKIDLTKSVPDITFGDFVKCIKNWFNYDLDIVGKLAVMNPVEDEINYDNTEDLQFAEIKRPFRKFAQGNSFLLKFQHIESKAYKYDSVFQNKDGIATTNYNTDEKTNTIEINALPLPLLTRNGSQTAHAFESNDSKVFLVKYDGLYNGNNLAQSTIEYFIPAVHLRYWKKWFEFRIFAQAFSWGFKTWEENLLKIKAKTKIFAYNRFHIIKNINKTEDKPGLFIVEIETNTLK